MHTYEVFKQYMPIATRQANPRAGIEAEHAAALIAQGTVRAEDGEDAIEQARLEYGIRHPIVRRVMQ